MDFKKEIEKLVKTLEQKGYTRSAIEAGVHRSDNWIDQALARGGNKKAFDLISSFNESVVAKRNTEDTLADGKKDYDSDNSPPADKYVKLMEKMIANLEKDKAWMQRIIETNLVGLTDQSKVLLAYQKTWVEYLADRDAGGSDKKQKEIRSKLDKLIASKLGIGEKTGSLAVDGK